MYYMFLILFIAIFSLFSKSYKAHVLFVFQKTLNVFVAKNLKHFSGYWQNNFSYVDLDTIIFISAQLSHTWQFFQYTRKLKLTFP